MSNHEHYKTKYKELKMKFISSVDTSWRLGYEAGLQAAQLQNSQQQAEQAQLEAQQSTKAPKEQDAQEEAPKEESTEESPISAHPGGSELDQHIAELESMLGKSELNVDDLKKVIDTMKFKKNTLDLSSLKKSSANVPETSKEAIRIQNEIVNKVMRTWEDEEKRLNKGIIDVLNTELPLHKE